MNFEKCAVYTAEALAIEETKTKRGGYRNKADTSEMAYLRYRLGPTIQLPRLLARLLPCLEIATIGWCQHKIMSTQHNTLTDIAKGGEPDAIVQPVKTMRPQVQQTSALPQYLSA